MTDFYLSWNPICVWIAKKTTTHQLKGRRGYNNNDKHKREKKERGLALLSLSLSLQILWWSVVYYEYAQRVLRGIEIQNQKIPKDCGLKKS